MKKSLSLLVAILMVLSLFPVISFGSYEDLDNEISNTNQWISEHQDLNITWVSPSDINLNSMPGYYSDLYDYSFSDGVLTITVKGNTSTKQSWQKAYEQSSDDSYVYFETSYNYDSLFGVSNTSINIAQGNGSDFFDTVLPMISDPNRDYREKDKFNATVSVKVAKISSYKEGTKILTPVARNVSKKLIGLKDDEGNISYKILLINVVIDDNARGCEITDSIIPTERVNLEFLTNSDMYGYKYKDGTVTIYATDSFDSQKITGSQEARIRINAPSGYVFIDDENQTNTDYATRISFIYEDSYMRDPENITIEWTNKTTPTDTITEKIKIKFDGKSSTNETWMDSISSPTNTSRIKIYCEEGPDNISLISDLNEITQNTNIKIDFEENGLIHVGYVSNTQIDLFHYSNIVATVEPPEGATHFSCNETGGGSWALPDESVAQDQDSALRDVNNRKEYDESIIGTQDEDAPQFSLKQFEEFEADGITTWYSLHNDGCQVLIIYWFDGAGENANIVGKDYIYCYVDDYIYSVKTPVFSSTDQITSPVEDPIVIIENGDTSNKEMEITYYPQDDEDGYYLTIDKGWVDEEEESTVYYTVLPFWTFGYEDYEDASDSGISFTVDHLDNANNVRETLTGELTENGILITTTSFSPFVMKREPSTNYTYVLKDYEGNTIAKSNRISEVVSEIKSDSDIIRIKQDTTITMGSNRTLNFSVKKGVEAYIEADDGYELIVNGETKKYIKIERDSENRNITVTAKKTEDTKPDIPKKKNSTSTIEVNIGTTETYEKETNPNTGAPKATGICAAIAISMISAFSTIIVKKK